MARFEGSKLRTFCNCVTSFRKYFENFYTKIRFLPLQKLFESSSVSKSGSTYADVFFQTQILNLRWSTKNYVKVCPFPNFLGNWFWNYLVFHLAFVPIPWQFGFIWFYASNVMGIAFHERADEIFRLLGKFDQCCQLYLFWLPKLIDSEFLKSFFNECLKNA